MEKILKVKKILSKEEKAVAALKYRTNFINRHFNGDRDAYNKSIGEKVKRLYHDETKDYKKVSDARRSELYFRQKENKKIRNLMITVE